MGTLWAVWLSWIMRSEPSGWGVPSSVPTYHPFSLQPKPQAKPTICPLGHFFPASRFKGHHRSARGTLSAPSSPKANPAQPCCLLLFPSVSCPSALEK